MRERMAARFDGDEGCAAGCELQERSALSRSRGQLTVKYLVSRGLPALLKIRTAKR